MRIFESGLLWSGDTYDIWRIHEHFQLDINGKFHSTGDNIHEITAELQRLEHDAREERIEKLN